MSEKIFTLPIVEKISPYISRRQLGELPIMVISHPQMRAAINLQGAHLLAWQPQAEQPVIWLSDKSLFKTGTAIRGGIPICWPWFGAHAQPSHGFARIMNWVPENHIENENEVILSFILKDSATTRQYWPFTFELIVRFKLGEQCKIELESHGNFQATTALHSYFQISDINQIKIQGLGEKYTDKVLNIDTAIQQSDLIFSDQTDRIYTQPTNFSLIQDIALKRTIEIYHHHHSDVVVWNPGAEMSTRMSDMPNEGYKKMVCVETARINRPLITKPDAPARMAVTLRSRKIPETQ